MTTRNSCPACSNNQISSCYDKNGYSIYKCAICGTLFVLNPPNLENLTHIYSGKYYELPVESVSRIKDENRRRLRVIRRYKPMGHVLDIGCARGDFLDEAKLTGYSTYGIELSLENVKIARSKEHVIFHGNLDEYCLKNDKPKQFDVISCLDVIEHVTDPVDFLKKSSMLLKDDGIMILTTPNYSGILAKVLRDKEPYMTPPEHLNFFTKKGMCSLFEKNRLQQKHYLTFGRLTREELKRVTPKYFPGSVRVFSPFFQSLIPVGLAFLNFFKVGMEHEYYLTQREEND